MDYGVATHEFHEPIMICGQHQSHNKAILKKDCHISNVGELANRFPFANEPNACEFVKQHSCLHKIFFLSFAVAEFAVDLLRTVWHEHETYKTAK